MAWFLRGLGQTGSDVQTAKQGNSDQLLSAQKSKLAMDEIRQRMSLSQQSAQQKTPEGVKLYLKGILGRDPTDGELQQYLGIQAKPATTPRNPYADVRVGEDGKLYGVSVETGKMELIPTPDGTKFAVPGAKEPSGPKTEIFGGYRWQFDPEKKVSGKRDPTGQYVQLGVAKEPGSGESPGNLDALVMDIAASKARMPSGRFGAQVASRAKQMGIDLPGLDEPRKQADLMRLQQSLSQAQALASAPTPMSSMMLAQLADSVNKGSSHVRDLQAKAKNPTGLMHPWNSIFGNSYEQKAYSPAEAQEIVKEIQQALDARKGGSSSSDLSDLGAAPAPEN